MCYHSKDALETAYRGDCSNNVCAPLLAYRLSLHHWPYQGDTDHTGRGEHCPRSYWGEDDGPDEAAQLLHGPGGQPEVSHHVCDTEMWGGCGSGGSHDVHVTLLHGPEGQPEVSHHVCDAEMWGGVVVWWITWCACDFFICFAMWWSTIGI